MNDPLGLFDEEPQNDPLGLFDGGKTSILEDLKTAVASVGNTADTGLSLLASVPTRWVGGKETQDKVFKGLNERIESRNKWANPQQKRQGLGGELISGVAGIVPNLILSPLSPLETGKRFLDAGESGYRTTAAVGTDALGQILGYKIGAMGPTALSRIFTGGAANAAQDVATRGAIQQIASTPEMQQAHEFSPSSTILSAAMGGAFGGFTTPKQKYTKPPANLKGLEETITPKETFPQRTSNFTVDQVPENLRAQQEVFNRTPEQYNPLRRYGEPNAVDHSNQIDLPFTEGPELIREAQVEGSPQPDMFVNLQKQDRSADPVMDTMQEQLFKDAIEQPVKDVETDAAYQQRAEQQNLEAGVSRLQDKFSVPKGQRGIFGGDWSNKKNKSKLEQALELTKRGWQPEKIWGVTGWAMGGDGRWRFEIDDSKTNINKKGLQNLVAGETIPVGSVIDHPLLFKNYPQLKRLKIRIDPSIESQAHFDSGRNEIVFKNYPDVVDTRRPRGKQLKDDALFRFREQVNNGSYSGYSLEDLKNIKANIEEVPSDYSDLVRYYRKQTEQDSSFTKTLIHELQHAVQEIEGFQKGYNWRDTEGKIDLTEWEKVHGEREAVLAENRLRLHKADRLYDYPFKNLHEDGVLIGPNFQLQKGLAVPRSQRGGIDLGPQSSKVADLTQEDVAPIKAQQDKVKKARNLLGTDEGFRANFNTPEEVIAAAPEAKDIRADQLLRGKTVTAGINRIAGATNNPVIKYVRDTVRKGFRSAENFARVHITDKQGMGPLWEKMSQQERNEVWQTWGMGDKNETTFTPEQLRANGFNERQISFMEKLYKASDELYTKAQESYEHAGLKGFRKRAGWRPGIFTGDYKTIFSVPKMKDGVAVLDKQGKPVLEPIGIISADTKWQRDAIIRKLSSDLQQKYPGAIAEDLPRTNLGGKGKSVTMLGDMAKIMDLLGGNDAAFKEVQDKIKEITAQVGSTMYGANLHALEKKGIFGNEGNKPWLTPDANTNEGMRSFFKYVEEAAMSYEMLKTQVDVTGLLSNPALDHMQNAKQYVQDYMKQATGRGVSAEGAAVNTLLDAPFKHLFKAGPSVPREIIHQVSKRMGQLTMGMLNFPFLAMQLLQVPQTAIPEMLGLARNADVSGLEFLTSMSKASVDASMAMLSKWVDIEPKGFQKEVIDYAHDNGLMNFSEFEDVSKITQSKASRRFDAIADWNRIAGEAATRPLVFFAFARMLENSGLPKKELLDLAYNKTQYAMIDYTPMERPMMYTKAGEIGKMAGGLKTFQHGFIGQQIDWIRRAKQGDPIPLLSGLAMAVLGAGITGATAYEELDYIFGAITDKLGKRQTIREVALKNLPTWLQDGVLSDKTNINVQSRLGMADVVPNGWADFLSPYASTMGRMATSAYDLAVDPNETTAANAALAWSPSSMRGVVENTLFKDREGAQKDKEERVDYPRTGRDWKLRYFGLTSMEESKAKKELFTDSLAKLSDDEARDKVLKRMKIGFRRSPSYGATEEFAKYKDIYMSRGGDPDTLTSSIQQDLVESRKTRKQRMEGTASGSIGSMNRYKYYND